MRSQIAAAMFCACASLAMPVRAADARVTDAAGSEYEMKSVRLAKGSRLDIECGGARIKTPFKSVKSMKVSPARIKSVNGKLHFGVELTLTDSTVIGADGSCFVPADNSIKGKRSQAEVTIPFNKLAAVYALGKEDMEEAKPVNGENKQPSENVDDDEGANAENADE